MRRNNSFTIIELLIVVIAIAILAAIAIPIFHQAAVEAEMNNAAANLEQELSAWLMELDKVSYLNKNDNVKVCEVDNFLKEFLFTDYAYAQGHGGGGGTTPDGVKYGFAKNTQISTKRDVFDNRVALVTKIKDRTGQVYYDSFSANERPPDRITDYSVFLTDTRFLLDNYGQGIHCPFERRGNKVSGMFITCNHVVYEVIGKTTADSTASQGRVSLIEVKRWSR